MAIPDLVMVIMVLTVLNNKTIETFKTITMVTDNAVIPDLVMVSMVLTILTVLNNKTIETFKTIKTVTDNGDTRPRNGHNGLNGPQKKTMIVAIVTKVKK